MENGYVTIDGVDGVFIRGDDAVYYATQLSNLSESIDTTSESVDITMVYSLKSLVETLRGCAVDHPGNKSENLDIDDGVGC